MRSKETELGQPAAGHGGGGGQEEKTADSDSVIVTANGVWQPPANEIPICSWTQKCWRMWSETLPGGMSVVGGAKQCWHVSDWSVARKEVTALGGNLSPPLTSKGTNVLCALEKGRPPTCRGQQREAGSSFFSLASLILSRVFQNPK